MKRSRIWLLAVAALVQMVILNTTPTVAAEHEHTIKVGKTGDVTFDKETQVGDLTLKPGRYKFQHRVEGEDHFVHFTEVTKAHPYGGGGGEPKAHPGEVKCKLEPLAKKVDRTTLYYNTEGGVNRLTKAEVAGENVAHVF
jgi:hypothetical protein